MNALFAIAAFCVAQEPEALKPIDVRSTLHVEGVVVDAGGKPVEGVVVLLHQVQQDLQEKSVIRDRTRTDAEGRFSVEGRVAQRPDTLGFRRESLPGPMLCLAKPGFALSRVRIETEWLNGKPARVVLPEAEELPVRVLGVDDRPVADANVTVFVFDSSSDPNENEDPLGYVSAKTDDEGRARLRGLKVDQTRHVSVQTEDQESSLFDLPEGMAKDEERVLRLKPTGKLVGRLVADDPEAVRNVPISGWWSARQNLRRCTEEARAYFETRTDADGRFELPVLAAGVYEIFSRPGRESGFLGNSGSVRVEAGKTAEVTLTLDRGVVVRGRVRERHSGRPLFGAKIRVSTRGSKPGSDTLLTEESGQFSALLRPGRLRFWLDRAGEFCQPVSRTPDLAEVPADVREFDLPPVDVERGRRLTGMVLDEKGEPTGPGRVKVLWVDHPSTDEARVRQENEPVDDEGRFTLHAIPLDTPFYVVAFTEEGASELYWRVSKFDPQFRKRVLLPGPADLDRGIVRGPVIRGLYLPVFPDLEMPEFELRQDGPAEWCFLSVEKKEPVLPPVELSKLPVLPPKLDLFDPESSGRAREVRRRPVELSEPPVLPPELDLFAPESSGPAREGGGLPAITLPAEDTPDLFLFVKKDQLRSIDGRVLDKIGHPVEGAEITVVAEGALPEGLTWSDSPWDEGPWKAHTGTSLESVPFVGYSGRNPESWTARTDSEGRFQTPRRVPASLRLKAYVERFPAPSNLTSSSTYAPTTPSFSDIFLSRIPPLAEQPVWDRVEMARSASGKARYEEALGRYEQALEQVESLNLKDPLLRSHILLLIQDSSFMLHQYEKGLEQLQQVYDLRRSVFAEDDPFVVNVRVRMIHQAAVEERYQDALNQASKVHRLFLENRRNFNLNAWAYAAEGQTLFDLGRYREAESSLEKGQRLLEYLHGPKHEFLVGCLFSRSTALEELGLTVDAEAVLRRAIEIADLHHYSEGVNKRRHLATMLQSHANLLEKLGRLAEAQAEAERAEALRPAAKPAVAQ